MTPLYERYRPSTWQQVVGQSKSIREIDALRRRGLPGRAFWIAGKSGTGKTSIARLISAEIAGPDGDRQGDILEIDAKGLTAKDLQALDETLHYYGTHRGRVVIINEAHGLTAGCVTALLTILERIPDHAAWIFTTTNEGQESLFEGIDAPPFISRCVEIYLTSQGIAKAFAARAREIALAEGLDGKPESAYLALVNDCKANFRRVLQRIEKGEMRQ